KVFGFGERKTPNPFIVACDKFIYLEILKSKNGAEAEEPASSKSKAAEKTPVQVDKQTISLISATVNDIADEDGWAFLGDVGNLINKKKPDFDPRNFGFDKLTPFIKSLNKHFDIDERITDRAKIKLVYIRNKK
ncbi:MAG: OST-HTH/LOTUS domain-containing protein, partial [Fulvivirga sp.]